MGTGGLHQAIALAKGSNGCNVKGNRARAQTYLGTESLLSWTSIDFSGSELGGLHILSAARK